MHGEKNVGGKGRKMSSQMKQPWTSFIDSAGDAVFALGLVFKTLPRALGVGTFVVASILRPL